VVEKDRGEHVVWGDIVGGIVREDIVGESV
jgi:hypothetical protein